jgi:beta-glucanase (GH16 family)
VDSGSAQPVGNIPGTWTLAFDDEFNGTSLDTNTWTTMNGGGWGSTTCETANVSVSGGNLALTLASASSGGCVCTGHACAPAFGGYFGPGSGAYDLPVGGYTEARVNFPGSGMNVDNWPAWWTSGPSWPAGGEHDIAEGLGPLTVTYHSPSGAHGQGAPPGNWANAFHVYGLLRMASSASVYYDGQQVASYTTDDNGQPESLIVDVVDGWGTAVYGAGSQVLVDYVRAWQ